MLEVPKKIFNRKFEELEVGVNRLSFFSEENLEKAQKGYRYDSNNNENSKWIGKEFVIIGNNMSLNEPIIAKTDDENIPIYNMVQDGLGSIEKIADSFDQYMEVLNLIKGTDLYRKDKIIDLLDNIEEKVPEKSMYYWEDLINSAYNFLTD